MHEVEPFYGWLHLYNSKSDSNSPFHEVDHNLFEYDRFIYNMPAHPQWDTIESESLLVKILYISYEEGYAILELFGEWNDLLENDFRLLLQNCLYFLVGNGVNKFIFICENLFNIYLDMDDYYQEFQEELGDGWICLLRTRQHVLDEIRHYNLSEYFFWSDQLDEIHWRKIRPQQLFEAVSLVSRKFLPQ